MRYKRPRRDRDWSEVWRTTLALAVVGLIVWLLWARSPAQPPDPIAEMPWGPGRNVYDCQADRPVNPLPPDLDEATHARVVALLKQACQEPAPR